MFSELYSVNLKLCSKQCNKNFVWYLIVAPQLSNGWQHNYSNKTRQAGHANEHSMYSVMSMLSGKLSKSVFGAVTLSITTLTIMTLSITIFSITTRTTIGLVDDTEHK